MSEGENQAISVLLPDASVTVFSKDSETLDAARGVEGDWRFARVQLNVAEGDVQTAISAYSSGQKSPDLLIVQTDEIGDGFTAELEALAGGCGEHTAAIVVGPDNDVNLYRKLIDMGVSDYLVRPLQTAGLSDIIARVLIDRKGVSNSTLVAFVGAKGGVGTTAIAESYAWGVSDILGHKALLLDAAGGCSPLSVGIGFEPTTTLQEAVKAVEAQDQDSIDRMIFKASDKLGVLASGGEAMLDQTVSQEQYEQLLDVMLAKFPVVLADLSGAPAGIKNAVVKRANEILLVSSSTLASLRLARTLLQEMKDLRGGNKDGIELVVNMQGLAPANEASKGDVEAAMECKPAAVVPFDPKLFVGSESDARKITDDKAGETLVRNTLLPVLKNVVSGDPSAGEATETGKSAGLFGGFLGKLSSKS